MLPVAAKTGVWDCSTSLPRPHHCAAQTNPERQQSAGGCPSGKPQRRWSREPCSCFGYARWKWWRRKRKGHPTTAPQNQLLLDKESKQRYNVHLHLTSQVKYPIHSLLRGSQTLPFRPLSTMLSSHHTQTYSELLQLLEFQERTAISFITY